MRAKVTFAEQRDLDGSTGDGTRLLTDQLTDEVILLSSLVKSWPVSGGNQREMVKWGEFWGELTEDDSFQTECPVLLSLAF